MRPFVVVIGFIVLLLPAAARGQSNAEVNAGIQFDFSLPGARSLAMGGAFVGLADDATATWSNPAGLLILARPEVSFEARTWDFLNAVTDRGHAFGSASNIGFDNINGLENNEQSSRTRAIAFLSYVHPRPNWAIGLYRHQLSNFEASLSSSGPFLASGGDIDRVDPFTGTMALDIVNYGASLSRRISDKLMLGAGLSIFDFSISSVTNRYVYLPIPPPAPALRSTLTGTGQRFGAPDFSESNRLMTITETGDDVALGANVGMLWREQRWSFGAAYRYGPTFDYTGTDVIGPGASKVDFYQPFINRVFDEEEEKFDLPDILALGFTVRPTDQVLLSFEYDRVLYSQLSKNNVEVFGIEENHPVPAVGRSIGDQIRTRLKFPDANQLRAGFEYSIVRDSKVFALRVGTWFDPDHRMAFQGTSEDAKRLEVLFRPGEDEWHVTPGFGFAAGRFQIDVGADISTRINTLSASTVFRF
jgi:long-chain fatty acid transport protein